MLEFWREQGLNEHLLAQVEAYRQQYPWTGERPLAMPRYRYYGREVLEAAVTAMLAGENLLLAGPKATGKNVLAENLAAALAVRTGMCPFISIWIPRICWGQIPFGMGR